MRYYKGHIYAAIAVVATIGAAVLCVMAFIDGWDDRRSILLLGCAVLALLIALIMCALGYHNWMPKWERDERRMNHIPGESWEHAPGPSEPRKG